MLANATTIEKDDFSDLFSGQIGDENFDFDISNMDDSLNLSIDNENIESQDDLPEIGRLASFMKQLEEELEASHVFEEEHSLLSRTVDSSDSEEEEEDPNISVLSERLSLLDQQIVYSARKTRPITELMKSEEEGVGGQAAGTLTTSQQVTEQPDQTTQLSFTTSDNNNNNNNIDKKPQSSPPRSGDRRESRSGSLIKDQQHLYHDITFDNFFSSAQDEHIHTPKHHLSMGTPHTNSSSRPTSMGRKKRSFRFQEEFTVESLKRNWDMEEEYDKIPALPISPTQKKPSPPTIATEEVDQQDQNKVTVVENEEAELEESEDSGADKPRRLTEVDLIHSRLAHSVSSSGTNLSKDERVKGDFMICSGGEILSNAYLFREYVGMYPTSVTHFNENGKLVPSSSGCSAALASSSAGLISNADKASNSLTRPSLTSLPAVNNTASGNTSTGNTKGYYNVHVMECIIRPDIELKVIMAIVVQLAKAFQCKCSLIERSHAVLFPTSTKASSLLSKLNGGNSKTADSSQPLTRGEFDCVDVQVCINRSVRQRVLLLQFMKRMVAYGGLGLGNILVNQLSGPIEYLSIKSCPETKRFMSWLRKELIKQEICLSSLYHCSLVRVCALPQGLDAQFLVQLDTLCRQAMRQKLEEEVEAMKEHIQVQEQLNNDFVKTIEPIYKHYELELPPLLRLRPSALDSFPLESDKEGKLADIQADKSALQSSSENEVLEAENTMSSPNSPIKLLATARNRSSSKIAESLLSKHLRADGMTFCLIMLDRCYQDFVAICDEEFAVRLQQENVATVTTIQEKAMYKRLLLTNLFNSPNTKTSPFQHAFVQLFQDVPIATAMSSPYGQQEAVATNNVTAATVNPAPSKTWFSSWMGSGNTNASTNATLINNRRSIDQGNGDSHAAAVQAAAAALTGGMFSTVFFKPNITPASVSNKVTSPTTNEEEGSFITSKEEGSNPESSERSVSAELVSSSTPVEKVYPDRLPTSILLFYCACLIGVIKNPNEHTAPINVSNMLSGTCYFSAHYISMVTCNNMLVGMVNNSIQLLNTNISNMVSSLTQKRKEIYRLEDLEDVILIPPNSTNSEENNNMKIYVGSDASKGGSAPVADNSFSSRMFNNGMVKLRFFHGAKDIYLLPLVLEATKVKMVLDEVRNEFTHT